MPDISQFEVDFNTYCKLCKNKDVLETDEPCDSCLTQGWNWNTSKPINFVEASKKDSVRSRKADKGSRFSK